MTIIHAILLGVVQGITEFLPISSQAHLLLVPYFVKWNYQGLGFDIGLHWGTLAAVLFIFGKDYWRYIWAIFKPLPQSFPSCLAGRQARGEGGERRLAWFLVIGTIPAAVIGYLFAEQAETALRNPLITVFTLAWFGFLMWWADKKPPPFPSLPALPAGRHEERELKALSAKKSLFIGFAQAIAIIPGVSRSGVTMTAGLFFGLRREAAARFSFLLSGPIILGAGIFALKDLVSIDSYLVIGFLSSAIAGFAAIKFLLNYLVTHNFSVFVWYRFALAALVLIIYLFR